MNAHINPDVDSVEWDLAEWQIQYNRLQERAAKVEAENSALVEIISTRTGILFASCGRDPVKALDHLLYVFGQNIAYIEELKEKNYDVEKLLHHAQERARAAEAVLSLPEGIRPEVWQFARLMEERLRANDHKGGWKKETAKDLLFRIQDELCELIEAVYKEWDSVGDESADVANFAMMVADVTGKLEVKE
jgi:hypothetical protein